MRAPPLASLLSFEGRRVSKYQYGDFTLETHTPSVTHYAGTIEQCVYNDHPLHEMTINQIPMIQA